MYYVPPQVRIVVLEVNVDVCISVHIICTCGCSLSIDKSALTNLRCSKKKSRYASLSECIESA